MYRPYQRNCELPASTTPPTSKLPSLLDVDILIRKIALARLVYFLFLLLDRSLLPKNKVRRLAVFAEPNGDSANGRASVRSSFSSKKKTHQLPNLLVLGTNDVCLPRSIVRLLTSSTKETSNFLI
jgi:hypothetical protein